MTSMFEHDPIVDQIDMGWRTSETFSPGLVEARDKATGLRATEMGRWSVSDGLIVSLARRSYIIDPAQPSLPHWLDDPGIDAASPTDNTPVLVFGDRYDSPRLLKAGTRETARALLWEYGLREGSCDIFHCSNAVTNQTRSVVLACIRRPWVIALSVCPTCRAALNAEFSPGDLTWLDSHEIASDLEEDDEEEFDLEEFE